MALSLGIAAAGWLGARTIATFWWTWGITPPAVGLGLGGLAFVVGAVWIFRRPPSDAAAARAIDHTYQLDERAATAIEIANRQPRSPAQRLVAEALYADAQRAAAPVDPAHVAPMRLQRSAWIALGTAALAALVLYTGWFPEKGVSAPTVADAPLDHAEAETFTLQLRETAELIRGEAEETPDPYVEALARAFDGLGDRVERGDITQAQLETELAGLMHHAERTLGDVASSGADAASQSGADGAAQPAPVTEREAPPDGLEFLETQIPLGEDGSPMQASTPAMDELLERLQEMEESLRAAADERERLETLQAEGIGDNPYFAIDNFDPEERSRASQVAQGPAAGAPIGAAQEANRGEGDLAGEGAQPIGEGQAPPAPELSAAESQDVALPGSLDSEGDRVDREYTPRTELSDIRDTRLEGNAAAADTAMKEFRSENLGPRSRAIASRYFDPNLDVQAEQP